MSAIANAKEVFRVISDVARALPVIVAKLPENDDPSLFGNGSRGDCSPPPR
jgi:hypothetical protein